MSRAVNAIMKPAAQATVALALAVATVATAATALAACPVAPEAAKAGVTRVAAPKAIVLFQPRPGPISTIAVSPDCMIDAPCSPRVAISQWWNVGQACAPIARITTGRLRPAAKMNRCFRAVASSA